jgi:hypothetical protein
MKHPPQIFFCYAHKDAAPVSALNETSNIALTTIA